MRKIFVCLLLSLILITGISGIVFAQQDIVFELGLAKEQRVLWQVYGVNPDLIERVYIAHVNTTPEEAIKIAEELTKEELNSDDIVVPEMKLTESTLGNNITNTISWFGDKFTEVLGGEWIELAEKKAVELKDVKQTSYTTGFKSPKGTNVQLNIDSPYLSPISLEVHEGTYVTFIEVKDKADMEENLGEEISLSIELPIEYLRGEWTIKERELKSKYATQVPNVTIKIKEYVGSIKEAEIDAERFLFSGEIQVEDKVYKAYTELDPVNIYADPSSFISILKEEGAEPVFAVMVIDMDSDYELFIDSDLELVYEKAFTIEIDSSVNDEYYQTDEDEVDYLVRK